MNECLLTLVEFFTHLVSLEFFTVSGCTPYFCLTCPVPSPHAHDVLFLKYWLWLGSLNVLQLGLSFGHPTDHGLHLHLML